MTALSGEVLLRLLQRYIRLGKVEHAPEGAVDSTGEIVGELTLQHEAKAAGIENLAIIGERTGGDVGQQKSAGGRSYASAQKGGVVDAIGVGGDLNLVFPNAPRQAHFIMMSALQPGTETEQADSRIRFAQVSRRRIKSLLIAGIGTRCGVAVFQNHLRRKTKMG